MKKVRSEKRSSNWTDILAWIVLAAASMASTFWIHGLGGSQVMCETDSEIADLFCGSEGGSIDFRLLGIGLALTSILMMIWSILQKSIFLTWKDWVGNTLSAVITTGLGLALLPINTFVQFLCILIIFFVGISACAVLSQWIVAKIERLTTSSSTPTSLSSGPLPPVYVAPGVPAPADAAPAPLQSAPAYVPPHPATAGAPIEIGSVEGPAPTSGDSVPGSARADSSAPVPSATAAVTGTETVKPTDDAFPASMGAAPVNAPEDGLPVLWIAGGSLAVLLLAGLSIFWFKGSRRSDEETPPRSW